MATGNSSQELILTLSKTGKRNTYEQKKNKLTPDEILQLNSTNQVINSNSVSNSSSDQLIFSDKPTMNKNLKNKCPVQKSKTNEASNNLSSLQSTEEDRSFCFLYANQTDANNGIVSAKVGEEGIFVLPEQPSGETLIEFLTKFKYDDSGKNLGRKRIVGKSTVVDFGVKIKEIGDIKNVLTGDAKLVLANSLLDVKQLSPSPCTEPEVKKFFRAVSNNVFGLELVHSSPTGRIKENPREKAPIIRTYSFPLDQNKINLIILIAKRKFPSIIDGDTINFGKGPIKIKSVVNEAIRKVAAKKREPLIKNLKRKAEENDMERVGYTPRKRRNMEVVVPPINKAFNDKEDVSEEEEQFKLNKEGYLDIEIDHEEITEGDQQENNSIDTLIDDNLNAINGDEEANQDTIFGSQQMLFTDEDFIVANDVYVDNMTCNNLPASHLVTDNVSASGDHMNSQIITAPVSINLENDQNDSSLNIGNQNYLSVNMGNQNQINANEYTNSQDHVSSIYLEDNIILSLDEETKKALSSILNNNGVSEAVPPPSIDQEKFNISDLMTFE